MEHVDVAIIGAGPGGGMAACELANLGLKVLLLEKQKLPRYKPCGGAMPSAITSMLGWDFSHLVEGKVSHTRFLNNYTRPVDIANAPILFVNRADFDYHLVERAARAIAVRDQYIVRSVEEEADGVIINGATGDSIRASYVIAADGAFSPTARALGLNPARKYAPAFDAEVEVDPELFAEESQRATFNYFCLPDGYGWIFPKRNLLACGVGAWNGQRINLRAALDDFLKRTFPPAAIRAVRVYGYPIPLYNAHTTIATRRVCLVGDAASLVDPLLGEGIRYALISGKAAAHTVGELLGASSNPDSAIAQAQGCLAYQTEMHNTIGKEFVTLNQFIAPIFHKAPDYFYDKFLKTGFGYNNISRALAKSFSFAKF